ncbi:hypothetical protein, partial [Aeromonas jandaei]|uniref:hypothetical protein n=2 Tax=Aeromonadaceae TaxID=84642 RepID=UPI002B05CA55
QNVPQTDIYELINWSSFFILTISSFILFTIFSFAAHKSDKEHDKVSGAKYMDIALAECSGILFNFGSLVLVITITTQEWIYLIATIVTYSLGVLIHPK